MSERWPRLLDSPLPRGRIRVEPEDFAVEEIPAYLPEGQGAHLLVEIEKRDLTTDGLIRELARALAVSPHDIGSAGMKDRRALTRQWLSLPAAAEARLASFAHPQARVLQTGRHGNKLKTGHLRGNRFRLRVRDLPADCRPGLEQRFASLVERGVPNYFGPQRFGRQGDNETEGRAVLRGTGRRHDRRGLRFVLNAVQAGLFNDLLAARLREGAFGRALAGDLLQRADSGAVFLCTEPAVDQLRADRLEVHPTGPMFGPKMRQPQCEPLRWEQAVLTASGLQESDWRRFAKLTSGTRRALRFGLSEPSLAWESDGTLGLAFALPAGCYATSVLRELLETDDSESEPDGAGDVRG